MAKANLLNHVIRERDAFLVVFSTILYFSQYFLGQKNWNLDSTEPIFYVESEYGKSEFFESHDMRFFTRLVL